MASDKESMEFYWEGDGSKIESYFYWQDPSIPEDMTKNFIMYNYNGQFTRMSFLSIDFGFSLIYCSCSSFECFDLCNCTDMCDF